MLGLNQWLWTIMPSSAEICAQVRKEEKKKKDSEGVDSRGCTPGFISQDLTRDEESLGSPSPHAASLQLGSGRTFYNHPIFM